jgi:hypothetical protein
VKASVADCGILDAFFCEEEENCREVNTVPLNSGTVTAKQDAALGHTPNQKEPLNYLHSLRFSHPDTTRHRVAAKWIDSWILVLKLRQA